MRIALAQLNVTVGALEANRLKMVHFLNQAREAGADLVLFPELAVTGYPPEDLLFKPSFIQKNLGALRRLAPSTRGLVALVGFVDRGKRGALYNAAALFSHGRLVGRAHKSILPNYGVFDEKRYFTPGARPFVFSLHPPPSTLHPLIGVSICEDIWGEKGPCLIQARLGARILLNLSASPYHAGKHRDRERLLCRRARTYRSWVCYLNLVGGQDELVFDGGSLVVSPAGRVVFRAPQFKEGLFVAEIPLKQGAGGGGRGPREMDHREASSVQLIRVPWSPTPRRKRAVSRSALPLRPDREILEALKLGLRDYVRKNGFTHVVLGLSGGIDSSLTAAIAVAALGPGSVTGVSMPSRYSSLATQADAQGLAEALGIRLMTIPIEGLFEAALDTLRSAFGDRPPDVTEENLQARIRGLLLMALSNKFNWLVLATGNKSEISTGYCTLYGDLVGGFAVIKDLPKTRVMKLARAVNRLFGRKVIPDSVLSRPPSAELKPNQRDLDTLPPYRQLDAIMRAYVEAHQPADRIHKRLGYPAGAVARVLRMIDRNEYKRRQAPVGIKITPLAFGRDRRMPITNQFSDV